MLTLASARRPSDRFRKSATALEHHMALRPTATVVDHPVFMCLLHSPPNRAHGRRARFLEDARNRVAGPDVIHPQRGTPRLVPEQVLLPEVPVGLEVRERLLHGLEDPCGR